MPDVVFRSRLDDLATAVERVTLDLLEDTAKDVRDEVRHQMASPKHGRVYPGPHVASAPGEAPAIRPFPVYVTGGELYASIAAARTGPAEWKVWTDVEYADFLEYGTSKMAPRPFMRPAAKKVGAWLRRTAPGKVRVALGKAPW